MPRDLKARLRPCQLTCEHSLSVPWGLKQICAGLLMTSLVPACAPKSRRHDCGAWHDLCRLLKHAALRPATQRCTICRCWACRSRLPWPRRRPMKTSWPCSADQTQPVALPPRYRCRRPDAASRHLHTAVWQPLHRRQLCQSERHRKASRHWQTSSFAGSKSTAQATVAEFDPHRGQAPYRGSLQRRRHQLWQRRPVLPWLVAAPVIYAAEVRSSMHTLCHQQPRRAARTAGGAC